MIRNEKWRRDFAKAQAAVRACDWLVAALEGGEERGQTNANQSQLGQLDCPNPNVSICQIVSIRSRSTTEIDPSLMPSILASQFCTRARLPFSENTRWCAPVPFPPHRDASASGGGDVEGIEMPRRGRPHSRRSEFPQDADITFGPNTAPSLALRRAEGQGGGSLGPCGRRLRSLGAHKWRVATLGRRD